MRARPFEVLALLAVAACGDGEKAEDSAAPSPSLAAPSPPVTVTSTASTLACGDHGCGVREIALGTIAACALLEDATVACYGGGIVGTLGRGAERPMIDPVPKRVPGLEHVAKIAGGGYTMCALLESGGVSCWGADQSENPYGARPGNLVAIDGLAHVEELAVSTSHTCALVTGGDVYCFGSNYFGELGDGTTDNAKRAVKVAAISGAKHIATGAEVSCAVLGDGSVSCWGMNDHGQLGQADVDALVHAAPLAVPGLGGPAKSVAASSESGAVCALLESGASKCWGEALAVTTAASAGAGGALSVGWRHACSLDGAGTVTCWGANTKGQLGSGSTAAVTSPVTAAGALGSGGASRLVTGGNASCTVSSDGSFVCWGDDSRGQLGSGRIGEPEATPQKRHF